MIPVRQRIPGGLGAPVPGDCLKCCIASVLERPYEEVPHFVAQELVEKKGYYLHLLNDWLKAEGYPFQAMYRKLPEQPGKPCLMWLDGRWDKSRWGPGVWPGWWLASVKSKRFEDERQYHVVVMHSDHIAFDPSDLAGTPEYDEKPYVYEGWHWLFAVPEPWTARPAIGGGPGYLSGHEMIRQLREALGMFDGAMPLPPQRVWEEALDEAGNLHGLLRELHDAAVDVTPAQVIQPHPDDPASVRMHKALLAVERVLRRRAVPGT